MYITTVIKAQPVKQMSFEDMFTMMVTNNWMQNPTISDKAVPAHKDYTRTWHCQKLSPAIRAGCNVNRLISILRDFNIKHADLLNTDLSSHYSTFYIPKASGGWREINAPDDHISLAHTELRTIFEVYFYARHHANAYAYINGRSTVDAVAQHQRNESKWFLKTDLSGFFPSTTPEFVFHMLSIQYPFALVCETSEGAEELKKALSICFLNGGLPMGTKISPMLTNLIMIPFDFELSKWLRSWQLPKNTNDGVGRKFVYTRYADDMYISCGVGFDQEIILEHIRALFRQFEAPYIIKPEKTHYGSIAGKNYILGIMLNKDNRMTIGYKKQRNIAAMIFNYMTAKQNGTQPELGFLQYLNGMLSYYKSVDEIGCNVLLDKYGKKFNCNILETIGKDIAMA